MYFPITFDSLKCEYVYDDSDKYFTDNYAYFIKCDNDICGFILPMTTKMLIMKLAKCFY